jgi:hypothetical protein
VELWSHSGAREVMVVGSLFLPKELKTHSYCFLGGHTFTCTHTHTHSETETETERQTETDTETETETDTDTDTEKEQALARAQNLIYAKQALYC